MAKSKSHPLDSLTFAPPKLADPAPAIVEQPRPEPTPVSETPTLPVKEEQPAPPEEETRSSNVTLPIRVWEWIDAKHAESRKGGKPLRKAAIIRAVFDVVMAADVDLSGTQSEGEIVERINRALRQ